MNKALVLYVTVTEIQKKLDSHSVMRWKKWDGKSAPRRYDWQSVCPQEQRHPRIGGHHPDELPSKRYTCA